MSVPCQQNFRPDHLEVAVFNSTGASLAAGSVVFIRALAAVAGMPQVGLARADDTATMPAFGVVTMEIVDNASGTAVVLGKASPVDTTSCMPGDPLYISPMVAGTLTNVKPAGNHQIQKFAEVTVSAVSGSIEIFGAGQANELPNFTGENKVWAAGADGAVTEVAASAFGLDTLAHAAFTPGSVIFAGAGGLLMEDNSGLFWADVNQRLGIGTNSPLGPLHIVDSSGNPTLWLDKTWASGKVSAIIFAGSGVEKASVRHIGSDHHLEFSNNAPHRFINTRAFQPRVIEWSHSVTGSIWGLQSGISGISDSDAAITVDGVRVLDLFASGDVGLGDVQRFLFGEAQDASIQYDGTDLVFAQEVGTGFFVFRGTGPVDLVVDAPTNYTASLALREEGLTKWKLTSEAGGARSDLWLLGNTGQRVVTIEGNAQPNSVYIADSGYVGLGKPTPGSRLAVSGLPQYADDAAAGLGGLTVGDFYVASGAGANVAGTLMQKL